MSEKLRGFAVKSVLVVLALALAAWGAWPTAASEPIMQKYPAAKVAPPSKSYEFPNGGRTLFPDYRLVALYGTPDMPVLGALGAQNVPRSIARVKTLAKNYQKYSTAHILPTFEIITTVASASPTSNHDYSQEIDMAKLRPWVRAAQKAGLYVVLDLQPGRTDFLSQAKQYTPLLEQPNVGLALDPEWRLKPHELPLVQIGAVNIHEVNATAAWLAELTKSRKLPQKLFLLHQFRLDMLPHRNQLDTSRPELAYAIQMDGQGSQSQKADTWRAIIARPPASVRFGWKNFYKKDTKLLTPAQTMHIKPQPWYISYQ